MCGGTFFCSNPNLVGTGLSPRVRGNLVDLGGCAGRNRSIPACAGEPACMGTSLYVSRVYPRVCGGTKQWWVLDQCYSGLSPRVRGNRSMARVNTPLLRSIPACAGEPQSPLSPSSCESVYPRVCGGTNCAHSRISPMTGLSPRVRGNPVCGYPAGSRNRSIPACAGEPSKVILPAYFYWVYPRVCGGTLFGAEEPERKDGLSPRVRGNRDILDLKLIGHRSIPACAGEPPPIFLLRLYHRGLSPRVRGNPPLPTATPTFEGSIPACAGEPSCPG